MSKDIKESILWAIFGIPLFFIVVVGFNLLVAFPLKWAWNYVVPNLFGLPELTWGTAFCLLIVFGLLIKGTGSSSK